LGGGGGGLVRASGSRSGLRRPAIWAQDASVLPQSR
jgi:hypothetical protein